MEDLSKYSAIELQKTINDINLSHDKIKNEIIDLSFEIDRLQNIINEKIIEMEGLENNYVIFVGEYMKR
jgi:prefoldin subunit 5